MIILAPAGNGPIESVQGQEELLPEAGRETGIFIIGVQEKAFETIPLNGAAVYPIRFIDMSIPTADFYTSGIRIGCDLTNQTEDPTGWTASMDMPGTIGRNEEKTINAQISSSSGSKPNIFTVDYECTAGPPIDDVVARFSFTAKLDIYQRFSLQPVEFPKVKPDDDIKLRVQIFNNGNDVERYVGRVEAPPGFVFSDPPTVLVPPKESKIVEINGLTPRDKVWYYQQSEPVKVTYAPESGGAAEQTKTISVTVNGLYFHPALIPFILLALAALVVLAMIIVYARRTVEEQVLGKPVPPWRIPIEREYLKRLEVEDPDEFYIVRYHLMVEEHQSALLWYTHFKHATRKDRKLERRWLKKTEKVKGKTERLRNRQGRLENRMARRLRVLPVRRRRRLAALDKRNLDAEWREQRRLLKIHGKSIKRIDKIHSAATKKEEKTAMAQFSKERKRAEKENKKRIRQGDDPLPLPEEPELDLPEPEFPEPVEVPLHAVEDSRFAVKAARTSRRYNARIAKRSEKAKRRMRKKGAKRDKKVNRLKSRLPPEPAGELYREDEFIPAEDVVVEDSRTVMQRALGIPDMETRDALKRRRMVYKVKIGQAKKAADPERVERLKKEYAQERARLLAKRQPEAGPDGPDGPEGADGGKSGLLTRRRHRRATGGRDPNEGAGDAAKQARKGEGTRGADDGSSGGDRPTED